MTDSRRAFLLAVVAFLQLPPRAPDLQLLHQWLDNCRGVSHIVVGMDRLGHAASLRRYHGSGWIASFHRDPMISSSGLGSGETPWLATQRAA